MLIGIMLCVAKRAIVQALMVLYHYWFQVSPSEFLETVDSIMPRAESFGPKPIGC